MTEEDTIVISGISGLFPISDSVSEFESHLYNGSEINSDELNDGIREKMNPTIKQLKRKSPYEIDHTFFGMTPALCNATDPLVLMVIERVYECIIDSGYNPTELKGSNVAVIMINNSNGANVQLNQFSISRLEVLATANAMVANRVSYTFDFNGPSYTIQTGGSDLTALEMASDMIQQGIVNHVIVGATSFSPFVKINDKYVQLGRSSQDGTTKSFSDSAGGYARAEASVALFLQRSSAARRIHANLADVKSCYFGYQECPLTTIAARNYKEFLSQMYNQNPKLRFDEVSFLEADGSAIKAHEEIELNVIEEVLCKDRKDALLIGSVKSNAGHAEFASGLMAITKALITLKNNAIPANLHYESPNKAIPGLTNGTFKVVTENTPLPGDTIAVNSIGALGGIGHAVLKANAKKKARTPNQNLPRDGIPRLVLLPGRSEQGIIEQLDQIENMPVDEEFIALLNEMFKHEDGRYIFRGFTILDGSEMKNRDLKPLSEKHPVWFVFSGMGSQWNKMGSALMRIPITAESIRKSHQVLEPKGVDLINIITSEDPSIFENILNSFVGIASIQIALVDLLRAIGVEPDGIIGHSVGELGCAYADDCMTAEQVVLSAYARGKASVETQLIQGMMAAIGLGYNEIKDKLPEGIEVACHNSATSCTLSGPQAEMREFVKQLKANGIFAKLVNVSNIAYHSKYIAPAAPALLQYLREVIPDPKPRSSKWVSSSVPRSQWDSELAKYSSAEYHTNNLLSYVLFEEASAHIPKEAVCIEIAPHGLLQAIIKRSLPNCVHAPLTNRYANNSIIFLLQALGTLYINGLNLNLAPLYPPVTFPISRGVEFSSNLIKWNQDVFRYTPPSNNARVINYFVEVDISKTSQHKVYHKTLIPLSFYLSRAISMFDDKMLWNPEQNNAERIVMLKNIVWLNDTNLEDKMETMLCQILPGSGNCEFSQSDNKIVSMKLSHETMPEISSKTIQGVNWQEDKVVEISEEWLYDILKHHGLDCGPYYKSVKRACIDSSGNFMRFTLRWEGNLEVFLEGLLTAVSFYHTLRQETLMIVTKLYHIIVDLNKFASKETIDVEIEYDVGTGVMRGDGIRAFNFTVTPVVTERDNKAVVGTTIFRPYSCSLSSDNEDLWISLARIIVDNSLGRPVELFSVNNIKSAIRLRNVIPMFTSQVELKSLIDDDKTRSLVLVSNRQPPQIPEGLVTENTNVFVLIESSQVKNLENMRCIFESTENDDRIQLFYQAHHSTERKSEVVVDANVIGWKDKVRQAAISSIPILLTCQIKHVSGGMEVISESIALGADHLTRYVLVESNTPSFDAKNLLFKKQLEKNMKFNIYMNSQWGCFVHALTELSKTKTTQLGSTNNLRAIRATGQYKGLKWLHICPKVSYERIAEQSPMKVSLIEFVGSYPNGDVIIGFGEVDDNNVVNIDPMFTWKCPKITINPGLASVPLAYATAYYSLEMHSNIKDDILVLIHGGYFAEAQAAIRVAFAKSYKVIVTVNNDQQRVQLLSKFTQLEPENVIYPKMMAATIVKVGKPDIILNYEGSMARFLMDIINEFGQYFQIGNTFLGSDSTIGMGRYLHSTTTYGAHYSHLSNLQLSVKTNMHNAVQNAIDNGFIQPVDCTIMGFNDTVNLKEINQTDRLGKKNVYTMNQPNISTCHTKRNDTHFIIGGEPTLWLATVKMLKQEVDNIIVVVDTDKIPKFTMESFQRSSSKETIKLIDLSCISASKSWNECLNEYVTSEVGDIIYYVSERCDTVTDLVDDLSKRSVKGKLVCVGQGGEALITKRLQQGRLGISLKVELAKSVNNQILSGLKSLLKKPPQDGCQLLTLWEAPEDKDCESPRQAPYDMFCPNSLDELINLLSNVSPSNEAYFAKVDSRAQRLEYIRDTSPVYVFPGFRVGPLDNLLGQLMYPVFKAILPASRCDIKQVCVQLAKIIEHHGRTAMTFLVEGFGVNFAMETARILVKKGKSIKMNFLDTSPTFCRVWTESAMTADQFLERVGQLSKTAVKEIDSYKTWTDKCSAFAKITNHKNIDQNLLIQALEVVGARFTESIRYRGDLTPLRVQINLIRPEIYFEQDTIGLEKSSTYKINVILTKGDRSFDDMMNNRYLQEIINDSCNVEFSPGPGPDPLDTNITSEWHKAISIPTIVNAV